MLDKQINISSLLTSRICHDLVSPLGAIGNGLELLELSGVSPSVELDLINQSSKNATAQINYIRVAFGLACSGIAISNTDIQNIINEKFLNKRLSVKWNVTTNHSRLQIKLICLLLLCIETGLPYGGEVIIEMQNNIWKLTTTFQRNNFNSDLWKNLVTNKAGELTSSNIHFELTRNLLNKTNTTLITKSYENRFDLTLES